MELERIEFKEKNSFLSKYIGIIIIFILVFWFIPFGETKKEKNEDKNEITELTSVSYKVYNPEEFQGKIVLNGYSEESDTSYINSGIEGYIKKIHFKNGDIVKKGDLLIEIENESITSEYQKNLLELKDANKELENAKKLFEKFVISEAALDSAKINAENKKSNLAKSEYQMKKMYIYSPIDGIVDENQKNNNEKIVQGDKLLKIVKINPITFTSYISQKDFERITPESKVYIRTQKETYEGDNINLSKIGDKSTRTFKIEIEVENIENKIPTGISSEIEIFTLNELLHNIPGSSLVILDKNIGVNTIKGNQVVFKPIEIISSSLDGIWVRGLSKNEKVIISGQNFVKNNEIINPIEVKNE